MKDHKLFDNEERKRYEFHIENFIPMIEYIKSKNRDIYLTHTEVPVALEGQGIGSQLVAKVLENIEQQGMRVAPLCPFVAAYIQRHPEWKRIVMEGMTVV